MSASTRRLPSTTIVDADCATADGRGNVPTRAASRPDKHPAEDQAGDASPRQLAPHTFMRHAPSSFSPVRPRSNRVASTCAALAEFRTAANVLYAASHFFPTVALPLPHLHHVHRIPSRRGKVQMSL